MRRGSITLGAGHTGRPPPAPAGGWIALDLHGFVGSRLGKVAHLARLSRLPLTDHVVMAKDALRVQPWKGG